MIDLYGKLVGKYTICMEGIGATMGILWFFWGNLNHPQKNIKYQPELLIYLHAFNKEEQKATLKKSSIFSFHPKK